MQLLEFGLSAPELGHSFAVVHLFDLIVLELLFVKFLLGPDLLDAVQGTSLLVDEAICPRVELKVGRIQSVVYSVPSRAHLLRLLGVARHLAQGLLREVTIPSCCLVISVRSCHLRDFLMGRVVVENFLRLLLGRYHVFYFV